MDVLDFRNKVVIVSGAAQGIGKGIATAFATKGAHVVLLDIKPEVLNVPAELPTVCLAMLGDVADQDFLDSVIPKTMDTFGRIDVLVNNVGMLVPYNIVECPVDGLQKTFDVNLKPAVSLSRDCSRELTKTKGAIISISSIQSTVPNKACGYYSMLKAATDHFTRCLALELAPHVRVNAVAPGAIDTPNQHVKRPAASPALKELTAEALLPKIPLGCIGTASQVAQSVLFLADPELSGYITGTVLVVDGGLNLVL